MRQILVDHARRRQAKKRVSNAGSELLETVRLTPERPVDIIALDRALGRLSSMDNLKSDLIEMRFFGGMTAEEIAECACLPVHTVRRQLRIAQAWLHKELAV
jgi:RNA polymerase sigma factor (TIGR02999 family)